MSEENVEIVRRVYEGWARGDFSRDASSFDPEIEFEMVDWPHPAKSRGIEEMRRTWQTTLSAWDDFRAEPDEFVDYGAQRAGAQQHPRPWQGERRGGERADRDGLDGRGAARSCGSRLYWDTARARAAAERRD